MPDALATTVIIVVLPLINVTVAPDKGCEVVQVGAGPEQATMDPLIVKPVTVRVTGIVCGLPDTATPALSVALIVIVPEYVPGIKLVVFTFTLRVLPLPLSVPDVGVSTSQELLAASPVAVQETGRAHVPASLNGTFCVEAVCPWATANARLAGNGDSAQGGGRIESATENVSRLPCVGAPEASAAERVTCVLYVPAGSPAILAATLILPD